jgi:hypothetical protein
MRYFVAVVLCALAAAAAIAAPLELDLPIEVYNRCQAGGGCILLTEAQVDAEAVRRANALLAEAIKEGQMAGYIQGALDAGKKCSRGGSI